MEFASLTPWRAALDAGTAPATLAASIAGSAEFTARHAGQTDAAYVQSLYQSGLGRAAEAAGLAGWTTALSQGATRGDVLAGIAGSAEATVHLTGQF